LKKLRGCRNGISHKPLRRRIETAALDAGERQLKK